MRHGARSLLAGGERFFRLAHFASLPVADVRGEPLDARRDERERGEESRVAIASDDLRRHRLRLQAERGESAPLDLRREMRVRPDRARDLTDGDLAARGDEPRPPARHLRVVAGQHQPERDRLGEDAVAASDHRRLRVLARPFGERTEQPIAADDEAIGGVAEQDGEGRIEDVARRHAAVEPARFGAREPPRHG